MKILKTAVILILIVAVFSGAMYALNFLTGPIIAANNAGPLAEMLPGGIFTADSLIYEAKNASASSLSGVPGNIVEIYEEDTGKGFVIRVTAESQYSTAPMEIILGVDATGLIVNLKIEAYNDTADYNFTTKDPAYLDTYLGKDMTLADVELVAGSTYSSSAFKGAVETALKVLADNGKIQEVQKTPEQLLGELAPQWHAGMLNVDAMFKAEAVTNVSGNIVAGYKANNDSGFAYAVVEGENAYYAVVNAFGACLVYDAEGNDVTADKTAIAKEVKAHAAANQKDYSATASAKFGRMTGAEEGTEYTAITLDSFNSLVYAASFKSGDITYYGFYARNIGYDQMDIYVVLDENGAIVKLDATALFFGHGVDYLDFYKSTDEVAYEGSFAGFNGESFTGENAMIAGATKTSNAVKSATIDIFAAFELITAGGAN